MRALLFAGALTLGAAIPAIAQDRPDPVGESLLECAPEHFQAAVGCLDAHLPDDTKATLKADGAAMFHFGLGMWIRNNWGLWAGGPLGESMAKQGFMHPDDMSGAILTAYAARLRGEEYDLEGDIKRYAEYWEGASTVEQVDCRDKSDQNDPNIKCFVNGNGHYFTEFGTGDN